MADVTQARAEAIKKLDADDKAREESAIERGQAEAKVKPTPTPREIDLAKLGLLDIDNKEASGAPPEVFPQNLRRNLVNEPATKGYKTRDAKPDVI